MKVLVAGSRGYCGIGVVQALRRHGWQVVGLDLSEPAGIATGPDMREIQADLLDFERLLEVMEGCQAVVDAAIYRPGEAGSPSTGVHLPSQDGYFDFTQIQTFQVNTGGTLNLLEAARQLGVRQVVLLSSARVIWDHFVGRDGMELSPGFRATVDTRLNFSDLYGLSKNLQEQLGRYYAREHGFSVTLFRPWWVVDGAAGQNRMGVPLAEDQIPLSPAGMVDRYDLGEACYLALQHPEITCEVFYPAAGPGCERYFDVQSLTERLGWRPAYTFSALDRNFR